MVSTGTDGVTLEEMTDQLGWSSRRVSPAAECLVNSGYTDGLHGAHGVHTYASLPVPPRLKGFVAQWAAE